MNQLILSDVVQPGETVVLFALVPESRLDVELRPAGVWMDPPTAAAFEKPLRVDVLTVGETLDLCGALSASVRLVVRNRSSSPARFRAEVELMPDLPRMEQRLGNLVDDAWRKGRDEHKRLVG